MSSVVLTIGAIMTISVCHIEDNIEVNSPIDDKMIGVKIFHGQKVCTIVLFDKI